MITDPIWKGWISLRAPNGDLDLEPTDAFQAEKLMARSGAGQSYLTPTTPHRIPTPNLITCVLHALSRRSALIPTPFRLNRKLVHPLGPFYGYSFHSTPIPV